MEDEPTLNLSMGEKIFEMNRRNASLFTFIGKLATHNHIFLVHEIEENRAFGTYVWSHHEAYEDLSNFLVEHDFPVHLNMLEVASCDLEAYDNSIQLNTADLDKGIPTDWV